MLSLFTACSSDDDPFTVPSTPTTYQSGKDLQFTRDGQTIDNAQVTYTPEEASPLSGNLTVALMATKAEATDVVPGSVSVTFPITITMANEVGSFNGTYSTEVCSFDYVGSIQESGMTLQFANTVINTDVDVPGYQQTYTDTKGLRLTYNGAPMLGKLAYVKHSVSDTKQVTVTLSGEGLDLTALMGALPTKADANMMIATAGVLPGTPSYAFSTTLDDNNTAKGAISTDYLTANYEMTVTDSECTLAITDATLKNADLSNTKWTCYGEENDWYDPDDPSMGAPFDYSCLHVVWESGKGVELFPGYEMSPGTVLNLALLMPMIGGDDTKVSVAQFIGTALQEVEFLADGNIRAKYIDVANGAEVAVDSPLNLAQYVVDGEGKLRLFLDPAAIIANIAKKAKSTRAVDTMSIIMNAVGILVPMLQDGVPMVYGQSTTLDTSNIQYAEAKYFALGTDVLLPLLKCVEPLFQDEEFIAQILEVMSADPTFGSMAGMMEPALRDMPEIIEQTTVCEAGLIMVPVR